MIPIAKGVGGTPHLPASRPLAIDLDWSAGSEDQPHTVWRQLQQQQQQQKKCFKKNTNDFRYLYITTLITLIHTEA